METVYDTIIVGGGLVAAALACGIAARGRLVAVVDGDDRDFTTGCQSQNFCPACNRRIGRPGMGPCQGRFCAATVEQIFARQRGESMADVCHTSARPPLKPITLGQLAETT